MNERARKILSASASDDLWKDFGAGTAAQKIAYDGEFVSQQVPCCTREHSAAMPAS